MPTPDPPWHRGDEVSRRAASSDARQPSDTQAPRRLEKFHRVNDGLLVATIEFPRFVLPAEIQTPSGPPSIDSLVAHDQTDPRACDLWISQIDILSNQLCCVFALCVNEPSALSIIPVEQDIDTVVCGFTSA